MNGDVGAESLVEEFLTALRCGEPVDEITFIASHPEHADELRELLPVMMEMEEYGRAMRGGAKRSAAEKPELPGSDYRLLREIGHGGMGTVWEALQISLNRKVAVKILEQPSHRNDRAWRERFSRESRIVAQLHHPNIVKVYGAGTCGDLCYYAMELVDGTRLDKYPFPDLRSTVKAILQAAQALAYAHRCGIVHRDVKPANLMIDADGDLLVTDFGLATVLADGDADKDAQNGTLRYMAPERLVQGECSFAADQYALGVTLWELLMRKPLFSGISGTSLLRHIRTESVPPVEGFDADLSAVAAKCTRRSPEERYRNMDEFAGDLQSWLDHRCVSAVRTSTLHRLCLWARRKPAIATLASAAAICAVAFVATLVIGLARTSAALSLAARNAALADAALGDVFRYVEHMSASRRGTELLSALLPYYGRLAGESGLAPEKAAEVNNVLGICALKSGDYALAEQAFRRLIDISPSAAAINRLSETLRKLGRHDEADEMSRRVAECYSGSDNARDRYESALALEMLGRRRSHFSERRQAFEIARSLLAADPQNPDLRFLYARLLANHPDLSDGNASDGATGNAYELFSGLASDYPDRPEYSRALVAAMDRRLKSGRNLLDIDRNDVELALDTADRLIGRYPNVPDIVSSVIDFRDSYSNYLRKIGDLRKANRESVRTTGMLELLSHSAEAPDAARLRYKGAAADILYRQIVVGSAKTDGNVSLILALHDRSRNGDDNVRQTSAPFLRTVVSHVEAGGGKTVILLPQCPSSRAGHWTGAQKNRRDGLLDAISELVLSKAAEFAVPSNRIFAVGVDTGGDACWALMDSKPRIFARALVAGAASPPRSIPHATRELVRETPGENRKTAIDNAFDSKSIDWLLAPNAPKDGAPTDARPQSFLLRSPGGSSSTATPETSSAPPTAR